jgi:S-formylglutathione hydrolase FrmB
VRGGPRLACHDALVSGPSRRTLLLGGAAVVGAAAAGVAAVKTSVLPVPGDGATSPAAADGDVDLRPPAGPAADVRYERFTSARRRADVEWALLTPPDRPARGLPVVLALHGRGQTARRALAIVAMPQFLGAHLRAGGRPFAIAFVDGGADAYWHPRASGEDPLGMVVDELLPRLADVGLRTDRVGAMGWSMGGYGALSMARESARGRLGGLRVDWAAAASPALFGGARATAPGAFDGPADWRRWGDLVTSPGVSGAAVNVSCGTGDPFAGQTRAYRAAVHPEPAGGLGPGRHTGGYWRTLVPGQLAWFAGHLP